MPKQQIVLCANDYPHAVFTEGTTIDQAEEHRKRAQAEADKQQEPGRMSIRFHTHIVFVIEP